MNKTILLALLPYVANAEDCTSDSTSDQKVRTATNGDGLLCGRVLDSTNRGFEAKQSSKCECGGSDCGGGITTSFLSLCETTNFISFTTFMATGSQVANGADAKDSVCGPSKFVTSDSLALDGAEDADWLQINVCPNFYWCLSNSTEAQCIPDDLYQLAKEYWESKFGQGETPDVTVVNILTDDGKSVAAGTTNIAGFADVVDKSKEVLKQVNKHTGDDEDRHQFVRAPGWTPDSDEADTEENKKK